MIESASLLEVIMNIKTEPILTYKVYYSALDHSCDNLVTQNLDASYFEESFES